MKVWVNAALITLLAVALVSCGDDEDSGTDPQGTVTAATVQANTSNQFAPGSVDIQPGESVKWVFGAVSHDVQFDQVAGAPANIGISDHKSVTRAFATAGVYPYHCTLHEGMNGTVRVGQ